MSNLAHDTEEAPDSERKRCEQCTEEKEIAQFRLVKNMYTEAKRMSICKKCYGENLEETQRRSQEMMRRWEMERQQQQQREREARQSALEQAMRDNPLYCKKCNQLRTDGSFILPGGRVWYHGKFCKTCTDNNPHTIYKMTCPLIKAVRYIGITTQSLNKRLSQHLKGDSGTEYKQYWLNDLRSRGLKPIMEVASEAPNERAAKLEEMRYIYHSIQQGDPLVNGEATAPQLVLFLQSRTTNWLEASEEDIKTTMSYHGLAKLWSMGWGIYRKSLWLHRNELVYLMQNGKSRYLWFNEGIDLNNMRAEYEKTYPTIMASPELPPDLKERERILSKATIVRLRAYTDAIDSPLIEQDCTFLLSRNIPIHVDDYTQEPSTSARLIAVDYPKQGKKRVKQYPHGKLIMHPCSYSVPAERAITI